MTTASASRSAPSDSKKLKQNKYMTVAKQKTAVPATQRAKNRDRLEGDILAVAVRVFAESGYNGASIGAIAEQAGISKQNLLYYFPTKQGLYERVLDDTLDDWLERMAILADDARDPGDVLRAYIAAKLRFSRERPWESRVYAMELIGGARMYGPQIRKRILPVLRKDIAVFEKWMADGRIATVDATHLIFSIWTMTQSYADFSTQMALVLGRKKLTGADYEAAETLIVQLVLGALGLPLG
jgi:TetR/AcrR family transcriptional regulator